MAVSLDQVMEETTLKLGIIWDSLGIDVTERAQLVMSLEKEARVFFAQKIKTEEEKVERAKGRVTALVDELKRTRARLKYKEIEHYVDKSDIKELKLNPAIVCLEKKKSDLQTMLDAQTKMVVDLLTRVYTLCQRLGTSPESGYGMSDIEDLSAERIKAIEKKISQAMREISDREVTVNLRCREIGELMTDIQMGEAEMTDLDKQIVRSDFASIGVSLDTLNALDARKQQLLSVREEREAKIKAMAKEISALWDILDVSEGERNTFLEKHNRLGPEVIVSCENERNRLLTLKQQSLSKLIQRVRVEIREIWDKLQLSDNEKDAFKPMISDQWTDERLTEHEVERNRLAGMWQEMEPVLKLIWTRTEIYEEKLNSNETDKDPDRFKKAGWHLQQEKLRKRWEGRHKLARQIRARIRRFEARFGVFKVRGENYLDVLDREEKEEREKEEQDRAEMEEKRLKKKADLLQSTTPNVRTAKRRALTPNPRSSQTPGRVRISSAVSPRSTHGRLIPQSAGNPGKRSAHSTRLAQLAMPKMSKRPKQSPPDDQAANSGRTQARRSSNPGAENMPAGATRFWKRWTSRTSILSAFFCRNTSTRTPSTKPSRRP
eukprot:405441_1